jgi:hypothetical protein
MPGRQLSLPFGPIRNRNLLSNHWLEHRLCLEPEWADLRGTAEDLLTEFGALWREQRERVPQYAEANLEQAFIQPVLTRLGWKFLYQTSLRGRKPDYALFLHDSDLGAALDAGRTNIEFWNHAVLVADAKAWAANLDRPMRTENQREYPPEQIECYIRHSNRQYGVLTNGRSWRLYPRDPSLDPQLVWKDEDEQDDESSSVSGPRMLWVAAVNNHDESAPWDFVKLDDPWDAENTVRGRWVKRKES